MNEKEINKKKLQDNDTLLYIILFLLLACLIFLAVIWYYSWRSSQRFSEERFEPVNEQFKELKRIYKSADDLIKLRRLNQRNKDSCQRKLDKGFNPQLTSQQKDQIREKLSKLTPNLDVFEFAARVRIIKNMVSPQGFQQKQLERQKRFLKDTFPKIEREAGEKINEVLNFFFEHCFKIFSERESEWVNWKGFEMIYLNDEIGPFSDESYDVGESMFAPKVGRKFPEPVFEGFHRFLNKQDEEEREKKEGSVVLGLTVSTEDENSGEYHWIGRATTKFENVKIFTKEGEVIVQREVPEIKVSNNFSCIKIKNRFICIRLKKEFLLNFEDEESDEWLERKEGNKIFSTDISWENFRETIAHELAHAVIDKMVRDYNESERKKTGSGDGKGHGILHEQYTREIEDIITTHQKGKEFENWWKKKQM